MRVACRERPDTADDDNNNLSVSGHPELHIVSRNDAGAATYNGEGYNRATLLLVSSDDIVLLLLCTSAIYNTAVVAL